ncbi:MAG TPA: tetratricopeptide repeat protein [Bryobacteraceae bacterium]|jgi:tetratricopeptide (TPR) repeat protein
MSALTPAASRISETIENANLAPRLVDGFRPIHDCLEARVSSHYWKRNGVRPFIADGVPYLVNNDGVLSTATARFLLDALPVPQGEIRWFEVGAGSALFARYLLDAFRDLCAVQGRDDYDRLRFIVTDASPATVDFWREHGIFDAHADRVELRVFDAASPTSPIPHNLDAVFCNYVLDSLPASILRFRDGQIEELNSRVHLIKEESHFRGAVPDLQHLRQLAASPDCLCQLDDFMHLLDFETAYLPASVPPPFSDEALGFASALKLESTVLNWGALSCLDRIAAALRPSGFILVNDYGICGRENSGHVWGMQRFGRSVAMPVNFPLLEDHMRAAGFTPIAPAGDDQASIYTRLFAHYAASPALQTSLNAHFGAETARCRDELVTQAQRERESRRFDAALNHYRTALELVPSDWRLLGETAEFLVSQTGDPQTATELARLAIELNPWYSPWLWNVFGDGLFEQGRFLEAHEAYLKAERILPSDPHTMLNLSFTFAELGNFVKAIEAISRGLSNDTLGVYTERLLARQRFVLDLLRQTWQVDREWIARRNAAQCAPEARSSNPLLDQGSSATASGLGAEP